MIKKNLHLHLHAARAIDSLKLALENVMVSGVPTATGSGQTAPIPAQKERIVENIKLRLPSSYRLSNMGNKLIHLNILCINLNSAI